jgi:hypothetical protein
MMETTTTETAETTETTETVHFFTSQRQILYILFRSVRKWQCVLLYRVILDRYNCLALPMFSYDRKKTTSIKLCVQKTPKTRKTPVDHAQGFSYWVFLLPEAVPPCGSGKTRGWNNEALRFNFLPLLQVYALHEKAILLSLREENAVRSPIRVILDRYLCVFETAN